MASAPITRVPAPDLFSPREPPVSPITPVRVATAPLDTSITAGDEFRMMALSMVVVAVTPNQPLPFRVMAPAPRLLSEPTLTIPPVMDEVPV